MNIESVIQASLIAPCGMNCGICSGHLRKKKPCPGCNGSDLGKPAYCVTCPIKHCAELKERQASFCIECARFPCARLKHLDKRYRTKYAMSEIENLQTIQAVGMEAFLRQEQTRWTCPHCGGIICVHKGVCFQCGEKKMDRQVYAALPKTK